MKRSWLILLALMLVGCGGTAPTPAPSGNPSPGSPAPGTNPAPAPRVNTISNLQASQGWTGYGLLPPAYGICNTCSPQGPQLIWSTSQGVSSPSLSGKSMQFNIGGQTVYSDVLWNNHLIGQLSSQGIPDGNNSINSQAHNFVYDVYFMGADMSVPQALEFDINQFVNGQSFVWGHQCRLAGGNEWDVWDNQTQQWSATGIACHPVNNQWNHVTIQVQRTSDGHLFFQSITLNGQTSPVNRYDTPTTSPWSGITVNYQQDGNYQQQPYSIFLDNFNFQYW